MLKRQKKNATANRAGPSATLHLVALLRSGSAGWIGRERRRARKVPLLENLTREEEEEEATLRSSSRQLWLDLWNRSSNPVADVDDAATLFLPATQDFTTTLKAPRCVSDRPAGESRRRAATSGTSCLTRCLVSDAAVIKTTPGDPTDSPPRPPPSVSRRPQAAAPRESS